MLVLHLSLFLETVLTTAIFRSISIANIIYMLVREQKVMQLCFITQIEIPVNAHT